jgi:hypothetical protein
MPWNCETDMGWHEAYLAQARSEHAVWKRLDDQEVEYCHRLHCLQMVTEKLAKAMLTPPGSATPAPKVHTVFVRMLQVLKWRPDIQRQLRYPNAAVFKSYIDSLLGLARRIERLSPNQAGLTQPNPEYPWEDQAARRIWAPAEYEYPEFEPLHPKMIKIARLIGDLLRLAN